MQEKGALGLLEASLFSSEYKGAELEPRVHVWEERRQPRFRGGDSRSLAGWPTLSIDGDALEEAGGGLVGADARRSEQTLPTRPA